MVHVLFRVDFVFSVAKEEQAGKVIIISRPFFKTDESVGFKKIIENEMEG